MLFSDQNSPTTTHNLHIGSQTVEQVGTNCNEKYFKFVGHVLDDKFTWEGHVQHIRGAFAKENVPNCGKRP